MAISNKLAGLLRLELACAFVGIEARKDVAKGYGLWLRDITVPGSVEAWHEFAEVEAIIHEKVRGDVLRATQ